ncbi:PREDICTED: leucine-rich repeat-containing protein 18-like [Priapulus caudatus]|uniref:Leucine-rich repeat-containing protein 18-like n=1 Tax=Priapulus caudatus TaxID=37621 RepID=A0ABM1FBM3_PRICU|nr:PREDICTED: leucine-rich repeat-containing protein 18-like [Priapulus caudatus]
MAGSGVTRVIHRCDHAKENQKLDLSHCQLTTLPDAVFHLMRNTTVLTFDLSCNLISRIPSKLALKFHFLLDLDLSSNKIKAVPTELADLPDLRSINFANNKFSEMPAVIYQLKTLKELRADNNQISDVDISKLSEIRSLRQISLLENPLTSATHAQLHLLSRHVDVSVSPYRTTNECIMDTVD